MHSRVVCLLIACAVAGRAQTADPRTAEAQRMIKNGNFTEAVSKLREVYDAVKQRGQEDTQLSEAAAELAAGYIFLDRYSEAEPLLNESVRIDHALFGEDSLNAARHSVVLAKLYIAQGKVHDAESLLLRARPTLERGFGADSPQVAALLNQLGLASDMLDRLPQAAALYRQAIAIYEKQSPKHRSLISIVISNLVAVLIDTGQYDEALRLARKSVALVEEVYGSDHPYVARALHNLGTALQAQKKMDEAKPLYERALAIWAKHPGVGTLDAATAESSLAAVYMDQGYYNKAESLLVKAVATREKFLGSASPDLASALNNLGVLYAHENRLTEARKTLERGLAIADQIIGRTHPRTVPLVANLGWVYYTEGRYHKESYLKSEEMYRRLLALQEQRFGPDRVEVSDALASLAEVCAAQKNYREARRLEERALAIRRVVLGPEHPDTVKTLKQYTFLVRKSRE